VKQKYLEIGQIVASHGLKGEMRVYPWCDDPSFLTEFDTLYLDRAGKRPVTVERARVQKNMVILKLEGVDKVEDTMGYRSKVLYMDRDEVELEPGSYFIQDLIGLEVVDADSGVCYGTLAEVESTGANDVYTIRDADGKERLIPAIPQVIVSLDIDGGRMEIRPLEGLFDA